jgi:hypothetical protein
MIGAAVMVGRIAVERDPLWALQNPVVVAVGGCGHTQCLVVRKRYRRIPDVLINGQPPEAKRASALPLSHRRGIGRLFGKGICPMIGSSSVPADACRSGACLRIAAAARSKAAFACSSVPR